MRRRRQATERQEKGEDRRPILKKLCAALLRSFKGAARQKTGVCVALEFAKKMSGGPMLWFHKGRIVNITDMSYKFMFKGSLACGQHVVSELDLDLPKNE